MSVRGDLLTKAKELTEGDREKSYGDPFLNMSAFADLLEGYFRAKGWMTVLNTAVSAEDAAWVMVLAKMARTVNGNLPPHFDNYTDAAAYVAMAGECADVERE